MCSDMSFHNNGNMHSVTNKNENSAHFDKIMCCYVLVFTVSHKRQFNLAVRVFLVRRANSGRVTYLVYGTLKSEYAPTLVLRVRISKTVNNLGTASPRTFAEGLTGVGPPDYRLECRRTSSRLCAVLGLLFAAVISLLYGSFAPKL